MSFHDNECGSFKHVLDIFRLWCIVSCDYGILWTYQIYNNREKFAKSSEWVYNARLGHTLVVDATLVVKCQKLTNKSFVNSRSIRSRINPLSFA